MPLLPDNPSLLFYLVILLVVLGSLFFGDFRNQLTRGVQQLAIWALIIASATILFSYKDDIGARLFPAQVEMRGQVIVLSRARDGHFYATLEVNGVDIPFIVDTGASHVVLSRADAVRTGLDMDRLLFAGRAQTANGIVRTAKVKLDEVRFGDRIDQNLRASVNDGDMETSLLGMTYLSRFSKIEIAGKELRLVP